MRFLVARQPIFALLAAVALSAAHTAAGAEPAASEAADASGLAPAGSLPTDAATADAAAGPADAAPTATTDAPAPGSTAAVAAPSSETSAITLAAAKAAADFSGRASKDDTAALEAFYAQRAEPIWIKDGTLTPKADTLIKTLRSAEAYGLDAGAFSVPEIASGAPAEALGEAEARLSLAALTYARHARGGRVDPLSISKIWDLTPPVKDPAAVIADLAASETPGSYLTGLHPKHAQFEKLRDALAKARGPQEEQAIDEALKVVLPSKGTIKPGARHDDIALLRKRLKMEPPAEDAETLFDPILVEAVKAYQEENGIKANGQLNSRTRAALNAEGQPKKSNAKAEADRIIANMERWRWLPEDLGELHVINNIPEFVGRVYKDGERIFEERIIIGQTTWPTPLLAAEMRTIVFKPSWGVPDGIKMKELLPRLKKASGGGGFFEELFGGGASNGARVLKAYGLTPSINGRPVDANSINWNTVDIRRFTFIQPPGAQNPLGEVKFMFPNKHDVYMHDTTQRNLFSQSFRALSHGCIRVQNPRKLAEILLAADKGWDDGKVRAMFNGGGEVALDKPIPVYLGYFTARVGDDGSLLTYKDLYGHDGRLLSALAGRAVRYDPPDHSGVDLVASETQENYRPAAAETGSIAEDAEEPAPVTRKQKKKEAAVKRKAGQTTNDILTNALSGLVAN